MADDYDDDNADDDEYDDHDVTLTEVFNTLTDEETEEDDDEGDPSADDGYIHHDGIEGDLEVPPDDADIPHCRGAHLASLFVRTFFRTVRRDWGKMDKYRVDKFYTLIRLVIREVYKYMAIRRWNLGIIRLFNDALFEEVLSQRPNGLRYHLIDLSLEELAKANSKAPIPLTEATFLEVLEPYLAMCQTGAKEETIQARVMDGIIDGFLEKYCFVSDIALDGSDATMKKDEKDIVGNLIFDQVHVGTIADFIFELASDPETDDRYRKSLYDMHKKYVRRLKKIGKDVELNVDDNLGDSDVDAEDDDDGDYLDEAEMGEGAISDIHQDKVDTRTSVTKSIEGNTENSEKKKKRKANQAEICSDEMEEVSKEVAETKHKRKKKKKIKESSARLEKDLAEEEKERENKERNAQVEEDEEVVISIAEQVVAKNLSGAKKKKKNEKRAKNPVDRGDTSTKSNTANSERKRVKFDNVNRSKSHKASMKALTTSTPPKTKDRTPEKGILRKKGQTKRSNTLLSKATRKKAVNYF